MARPYSLTFGGWREGDDPLLIARDVAITEVDLRRFRLPLEAARQEIIRGTERRFYTETSPEGAPWARWSESYYPRANVENISILRKQKEFHRPESEPQLFDAATSQEAYIVQSYSLSSGAYSGGDVALVGEALPEYWVYHQEGTTKMPARPFLGADDQTETAIYAIFDGWVDRSFRGMVQRGPNIGQPIVGARGGEGRATFAPYYSER